MADTGVRSVDSRAGLVCRSRAQDWCGGEGYWRCLGSGAGTSIDTIAGDIASNALASAARSGLIGDADGFLRVWTRLLELPSTKISFIYFVRFDFLLSVYGGWWVW